MLAFPFLALFSFNVSSQSQNFPSLTESVDPALQQELEYRLERLGLNAALKAKKLAVALVDITDQHQPRVASLNGDMMMYSASLPKIAILLGAFQRIEEGRLKANKETLKDITDMIRYSSNVAATRVLNMIGPFYLINLLQSDRYHFYDAKKGGGLWVGKPYGKNPAYQRDPLFSLSHGATALQVARYYYLLDTGRLVSREASQAMKEILGNPGLHHKFVAGLEKIYPDTRIYRKSGTWQTYHSDSAIIERDGRTYIAVALANDPRGGDWMPKLIVEMDDLIFADQDNTQIAGIFRQRAQ
ncbi:MAG: serine hydrolase [Gammaproteobacteria bacterium]